MSIKSAQEDIMRMYRNGRTPSTATELIPAVGTLVNQWVELPRIAGRLDVDSHSPVARQGRALRAL